MVSTQKESLVQRMKHYSELSESGLLEIHRSSDGAVLAELQTVQADERHRNFILSTWVKSAADINRRSRMVGSSGIPFRVDGGLCHSGESEVAEAMWPKSTVLTSGEDAFAVHAWICNDGNSLLHCYVPPPVRRMGIASTLILSLCGKSVDVYKPYPCTAKGVEFNWNPYMLQSLLAEQRQVD